MNLAPFAKAIIALVLALAGLAGQLDIAIPAFINEETLTTAALAIMPLLVYFVPNGSNME